MEKQNWTVLLPPFCSSSSSLSCSVRYSSSPSKISSRFRTDSRSPRTMFSPTDKFKKKKKSIKAEPEQESRLLPAAKLASQLDSRFVTARSKLICSTKGPVFPQFLGRGGLISCKHQALSPTGETPCASLDHHLTGSERDVLSVC